MVAIMTKLKVLDPSWEETAAKGKLSRRLDTLDGKTLGILWNGRPTGDKIFDGMVKLLKERHKIKEVVLRDKPYIGNIAPPEIFEELAAKCNAVVTGVGD